MKYKTSTKPNTSFILLNDAFCPVVICQESVPHDVNEIIFDDGVYTYSYSVGRYLETREDYVWFLYNPEMSYTHLNSEYAELLNTKTSDYTEFYNITMEVIA